MGFFIGKQGEYIKRIQAEDASYCLLPSAALALAASGTDGCHRGLDAQTLLPLQRLSLFPSFSGMPRPRSSTKRRRTTGALLIAVTAIASVMVSFPTKTEV